MSVIPGMLDNTDDLTVEGQLFARLSQMGATTDNNN